MRIVTAAEEPALAPAMRELGGSPWPEFLLHSPVMNRLFGRLYDDHPHCQYAGVDDHGVIVAVGNCVPVRWTNPLESLPREGVEWAVKSAYEVPRTGPDNLLCAIQIVVQPALLGTGLSAVMVRAMREIARRQGLDSLIAPVRPIWKHRYPLVPMERYARWVRPDGLPYDPWVRVHVRLGASIIRVCEASLTVVGTRDDWEKWTGLHVPESGDYTIAGGLVPMHFDAATNQGWYVEPNVWMLHP